MSATSHYFAYCDVPDPRQLQAHAKSPEGAVFPPIGQSPADYLFDPAPYAKPKIQMNIGDEIELDHKGCSFWTKL
jgi:hypothetical protein